MRICSFNLKSSEKYCVVEEVLYTPGPVAFLYTDGSNQLDC